jgi:hypothetical protein
MKLSPVEVASFRRHRNWLVDRCHLRQLIERQVLTSWALFTTHMGEEALKEH